jgi:ribosomal protein S18 acetylase RimI-like enzyme
VLIRPAESADVAQIRVVVEAAYGRYVTRMGRRPAPMTADYAALVAAGEVWVGAGGEEIVGVLVIRPSGDALEVENVAVDPAYQGRGHGRTLIAFAEARARELGLTRVTLYTNAAMVENVAMYRQLGYVETDRRVEDGYRRVFFEKSLDYPDTGR